ncbi:MAG TPA: CsbD family protein [Rhodanobacteraceae bacterium]|nr:CsbD family protein [Rhodanobacteraceae bacterium]
MTTLPPPTHFGEASRLDRDRIKEEWSAIAGRIRRRWRQVTIDDVSYAGGTADYLAGVLQMRYGFDRREAMLQVYEFESEL